MLDTVFSIVIHCAVGHTLFGIHWQVLVQPMWAPEISTTLTSSMAYMNQLGIFVWRVMSLSNLCEAVKCSHFDLQLCLLPTVCELQ